MRPKGMQCLPSLRASGERKVTGLHELASGRTESRAKVASSIARLEHEHQGLQDRLAAHSAIRAELEARLAHVHELLSQLTAKMNEELLQDPAPSVEVAKRAGNGYPRRTKADAKEDDGSQVPYQVVSIEY